MKNLSYCIMCLASQVKMFHLNEVLLRIYQEIISIPITFNIENLYACYECANFLHKYGLYKTKCCTAYNILCSLSSEPFVIKEEQLKSIDRKHNKLESVLAVYKTDKYKKIRYCDSDKQFSDEIVNTESVLIRLPEQFNENKQEQIFNADSIVIDDHPSNKLNSGIEIVNVDDKNTPENNIEDDDRLLNILKNVTSTNSSNKDNILLVENTNIDLETNQDAKNNIESHIELELEFKDSNISGVSCIKSNICPNKVDNHINISITTNRNSNVSEKNIYKESKKRIKVTTDSEKYIVQDKGKKKHGYQNNGTKYSNVSEKAENCGRFSVDSVIFKEHMTIIKLTSEDAKSELLLRKESRNYKMNSHKCDLCYRGFISHATYDTHMKKHSLEYGTLKCDICQLSFTESRYLTNHRIVCHTRKFLCKICPYVCFGPNQARAHIQSHKGKKYTCKECGDIFRYPNSLSSHVRLRHSVELVCEFCGSTFASPKGLDCHKRLLHRKEKNDHLGPKCDECEVHFASELAWKRHRVLCSRHNVTAGCAVCGNVFADAGELRAHMRSHGALPAAWSARLRPKPSSPPAPALAPAQSCAYCDCELRNKKEYMTHIASAHPQVDETTPIGAVAAPLMKWVCEVCGKMFKHYSLFTSHHRKHTGEKPFSCPDCGKTFKRAAAARTHRSLHTRQYSFKCHLCDKAYGDRGKLNRHVKSHLGVRPYKCSYCDKSFPYQCVANAHTKYVHCKEPYPKRDRSKKNKANLK